MSAKHTVAMLLEGGSDAAAEYSDARIRCAHRVAWALATVAAIRKAQRQVDEAWDRRLDAIADGGDGELSEDVPEAAALNTLLAQAEAARDHDRWPKALYWGGI
jgi:hypothetical protein